MTGTQILEEVAGKEGVTFFRGSCNCHIKNKLKSEIFNDNKSLEKKTLLSDVTKNSNWEILPKNLVTFKRQEVLRMENFNILGVHRKLRLLGGFSKNQYRRRD